MRPADIAVYIDPFSRRNEQDRLFDPASEPYAGDNAFEPFAYLRRWFRDRGISVHTADLLDLRARKGRTTVYLSFGMRARHKMLRDRPDVHLSAFFAFECPVVLPDLYRNLHEIGRSFGRVYSFSTEEALQPFLRGRVELKRFMLPQSFDKVHEDVWKRGNRSFLTMVTGNKVTRLRVNELYTERIRAIEFFHRYGEIDLYGRGWDGPPSRLASRRPRAAQRLEQKIAKRWQSHRPPRDPHSAAIRASYRGLALDKAETLGAYTFAVCFENMVLEGWITEKIFDCFWAGTVPIYLGAPDVERWIPRECYVDMRQFGGYEDLREFLHSLDRLEIDAYREAARDFIGSERFRPFSKQTFAELLGQIVEEDVGVPL